MDAAFTYGLYGVAAVLLAVSFVRDRKKTAQSLKRSWRMFLNVLLQFIAILLLVGLPPAHFGAQYQKFEQYFTRSEVETIEFHSKTMELYINQAVAFPQAFAASMLVYLSIKDYPKVMIVDIGGFTADYLLMKSGQADLSVCDTLEHGFIILYNQVASRVSSDFDMLLDESDIDSILKEEPHDYPPDVVGLVQQSAQVFTSDLFSKLRERMVDLRSGRTVFVGGESILLRSQILASGKVGALIFVESIAANAKGYELLYASAQIGR
jgi:plasmid segregation protein ParM